MDYEQLTESEKVQVSLALDRIGECDPSEVYLCTSGQVYFGLTEILPRGSIAYRELG